MGDTLEVIHQFDGNNLLEDSIIRALRDDPRIAQIDLIALRDIITEVRADLIDHTDSINMAYNIGLEHLGPHKDAAILWGAHPLAQDWFKRLKKEGHTGERVLLRDSDLNNDIAQNATDVIRIPTSKIIERIYAALGIK